MRWSALIGLAVDAGADVAVVAWLDRRPGGTPRLAAGGMLVAALAFPLTVLAAPFGWAALPRLAQGAGGYARYTMVGKLALGAAELAMKAALNGRSDSTAAGLAILAGGAAAGCLAAALLLMPAGLTSRSSSGATHA